MQKKPKDFLTSIKVIVVLQLIFLFTSCNTNNENRKQSIIISDSLVVNDSLAEVQKHLPENALKGLLLAKGLEVKAMASEPMLKNPTNIDVDEKGRVWVVEAFNYRPKVNGNPVNPQGDRIVILEDVDKTGKFTKGKVFYQGPEINSPMGICILGNKVLISQSPYVWIFYDDNGDDSADRKEILFQGIGGEQHDHGMHTFSVGPDGKLYFNFGNEGKTLKDKNGKVVLDQDGDEIGPGKYRQGMVFRCNINGSNVECLGSNFRNTYEVAVDSYGTMWQSDNDDDGNKGVRINYVMEYGNYGYTDEITGAGWQASRTNIEDSIYARHWHLNDPGVIPNLLQTGAGSPTGMLVYEGNLLPQQYYGQMIHCEPGQNVVRSYPVSKYGAGYTATISNILHDDDDQWFRPADVSAAPDGSLMIADWYDPGVGGHGAGDQDRGRIFRVAPTASKYSIPALDLITPEGAVAALQSPNLATRYLAFTALLAMGDKAIPSLESLWHSKADSRMRARALWVLSKFQSGKKNIDEALKDADPDLKITGLRAARQIKYNVFQSIASLVNDTDPQVRRECALALRHNKLPEAAKLWATLANQYNGTDRWYLEALGISADKQWDRFFKEYASLNKTPLENAQGKDIIWRSRGESTLPLLAKLAMDSAIELKQRLRYFRSFDFQSGLLKQKTLLGMLKENKAVNTDIALLTLHHLDPKVVLQSAVAKTALAQILKFTYGTPAYLELVRQYKIKSENPQLVDLVISKYKEPAGAEAVRLLLESGHQSLLQNKMMKSNEDTVAKLLTVFGVVGYTQTIDMLQEVMLSDHYSKAIKMTAADMMGKSYGGEDRVVDLLRDKLVPDEYIVPIVHGLEGGLRSGMYKKAQTYLPGGKNQDEKPAPSIALLVAMKGNPTNGISLFQTSCKICHQVKGEGANLGPKLNEIGTKLPAEGLYKSIINPSSAISFGYETTLVTLKNSTKLTGIISSKTKDAIEIKFPGGAIQKLQISDIKTIKELPESMMPKFYESLSNQEIADIVSYLTTLKKK
ncbi:MAG: c-type cytochrome [Ferruginibacter sp.]|nr:c-type cytochrome [Ferruginibacter sp.]